MQTGLLRQVVSRDADALKLCKHPSTVAAAAMIQMMELTVQYNSKPTDMHRNVVSSWVLYPRSSKGVVYENYLNKEFVLIIHLS